LTWYICAPESDLHDSESYCPVMAECNSAVILVSTIGN